MECLPPHPEQVSRLNNSCKTHSYHGVRDGAAATVALLTHCFGGITVNRNRSLSAVLGATAARLLPISLAIALTAAAHGQANYAGTQTLVTGLPNVQASGFTVDPAGNIYICDQYDNQLDEAVLTQSGYGPLTPILSGVCNQQVVSSPIAVDDVGNVFYFDPQANQLMRATKIAAGFGPPISVNGTSNNLSNPVGIAIDFYGDVYVADSGIGRVVEFPFNGSAYQPLQSVFNGLADLTGVTVDRARTVYITQLATGDIRDRSGRHSTIRSHRPTARLRSSYTAFPQSMASLSITQEIFLSPV